ERLLIPEPLTAGECFRACRNCSLRTACMSLKAVPLAVHYPAMCVRHALRTGTFRPPELYTKSPHASSRPQATDPAQQQGRRTFDAPGGPEFRSLVGQPNLTLTIPNVWTFAKK